MGSCLGKILPNVVAFGGRSLAFGARATPSGSFASVVLSSWLRPCRLRDFPELYCFWAFRPVLVPFWNS